MESTGTDVPMTLGSILFIHDDSSQRTVPGILNWRFRIQSQSLLSHLVHDIVITWHRATQTARRPANMVSGSQFKALYTEHGMAMV